MEEGVKSGDQVERLALNCAQADGNEVAETALERLRNENKNSRNNKTVSAEFPALRHLQVRGCPPPIVAHFADLGHLESLNLSGNGLTQLGWQQLGSSQLRLLDLSEGNRLDCANCENAWMRPDQLDPMMGKQQQQQQQQGQASSGWPTSSLFPTLPQRVLTGRRLRNCSFAQCPVESAKFEPIPSGLRLGAPLELKCQFQTENPLPVPTANGQQAIGHQAIDHQAIGPIFVWTLNNENADEGNGEDEAFGNGTAEDDMVETRLLPAQNVAQLRIPALRSHHLGLLACRCLHCRVPRFDLVPLRFRVPISVHIPPGQPPGEQHLTMHGFPLDGPVWMRITRLADNQTEVHTFGTAAGDDSTGMEQGNGPQSQHQQQPKAHLFFNGSLAIRPEPGHDHFFLRYFTLAVHECSHCRHAQSGGLFRFQVCVNNNTSRDNANNSKNVEKDGENKSPMMLGDNCATVEHLVEPPAHPVSKQRNFRADPSAAAASSTSLSTAILHFLLSIPPILLSLALLTLGGRTIWRLRQRMAIREKLKRRSRRASRNTQRTEDTSIPLDTMSRSLSLSNYIQNQLQVPFIDSRDLQLNERIGKGAFGEVFVGIWKRSGGPVSDHSPESTERLDERQPALQPAAEMDSNDGQQQRPLKVAVKMLFNAVHLDAEMDREAALLARLEHPNVLRMFGIAHWNNQCALVLELMNLGDLRNYLRNREPRCNNYAQFPPALIPTELVDICLQICEGLCYLASQQVVHRDLAARNCLVSGESDLRSCSAAFRPSINVKISDFGMSRRLYACAEYYRMQDKRTALPVRWMPPECLSSGKFTPQSDIWSFGVLLYEVFSFGGMPFAALSNGEVLTAVLGGMKPEVPQKCAPELAQLMRDCWHRSPQKRISALEALQRLRQIQLSGGGTATAETTTTSIANGTTKIANGSAIANGNGHCSLSVDSGNAEDSNNNMNTNAAASFEC